MAQNAKAFIAACLVCAWGNSSHIAVDFVNSLPHQIQIVLSSAWLIVFLLPKLPSTAVSLIWSLRLSPSLPLLLLMVAQLARSGIFWTSAGVDVVYNSCWTGRGTVGRSGHGLPIRISWMKVSCVIFTRTILRSLLGHEEDPLRGRYCQGTGCLSWCAFVDSFLVPALFFLQGVLWSNFPAAVAGDSHTAKVPWNQVTK